jgi:hypothetical protein
MSDTTIVFIGGLTMYSIGQIASTLGITYARTWGLAQKHLRPTAIVGGRDFYDEDDLAVIKLLVESRKPSKKYAPRKKVAC